MEQHPYTFELATIFKILLLLKTMEIIHVVANQVILNFQGYFASLRLGRAASEITSVCISVPTQAILGI